MRRIYILIEIALVAILATSCLGKEMQEEFVNSPAELGLTFKGEKYDRFTEETSQYGYRKDVNEFRVSNDNMSDYFVLRLERIPSVGDETTGTLIYTTVDDIVTKSGMHFKLVKAENEYYWFWNKKNSIGAVVRKL